ncbi:hypothetical protein K469DRAFT_695821 [Zopfia rhizophila CBS 207.26]|uniref:Uncharacterized protein n=1 Tax=Zopfia rhizophila CBS 207.26 TaxID=1314779 RepID=A0A6A6ENL3_9PEZI|nr:hypothetical protein K469DRAFT_695821 [Zopfia rhizophila CBS 207.26]
MTRALPRLSADPNRPENSLWQNTLKASMESLGHVEQSSIREERLRDCLNLLLDAHSRVDARGLRYVNVLQAVVRASNLKALRYCLESMDPALVDEYARGLLVEALLTDNVEIDAILLSLRADVTTRDGKGDTALIVAARSNDYALQGLLE